MNTRQRIIKAALTLFAEKGYSDVYVSDIASAVGIKAPSLYKHFKSKQEIFDAILDELREGYTKQASLIGIDGNSSSADAGIYTDISESTLIDVGKNLFLFFLHNEQMKLFRKLLTLEQFRSSELSQLYTKQYFDDPIGYQEQIFRLLIHAKKIRNADPRILALEFYSPIYALLTVCDRDPGREAQALDTIEKHIKQFNKNYQEVQQ